MELNRSFDDDEAPVRIPVEWLGECARRFSSGDVASRNRTTGVRAAADP